MVCPICFGRRLLIIAGQVVPCPECAGHGEIHCCEALEEQVAEEIAQDPGKEEPPVE